MMDEIYTIHDMALNVLVSKPEARNDDWVLFYWICKKINPEVEFMPFSRVLLNHKLLGLPSIETVSRCRRKLCEEFEELKGSNHIEKGRKEKQEEYKRYAKGIL